MKIPNFLPSEVPPTWSVCFHEKCPLRKTCLRYVAGQVKAAEFNHGPAVYPSALSGDKCELFHPIRVIQAAWGFRSLFRDVRHEDYASLRAEVRGMFGSDRNFYRYNSGRYIVTPEKQAKVLAAFARRGYDTKNLRFEHYREQVDFS